MVRVDNGIPLPAVDAFRQNRGEPTPKSNRWPWGRMKRGDSFFAPHYVQTATQRLNGEKIMNTSSGKQVIPGSHWATRVVTENGVRGVRVWRVL
jgi:hypothetical protein